MSNKRLSKDERRRINTRKKRDKKAAAQTKRFASLKIPIIDTVRDAFQLRDGGFMDMLAIRTKDLENASEEDVNRDMWLLTSLFKRYSDDIKIISINFPTNTKTQQAYFEQKLMHCSHPLLKPILEEKLAELEKEYTLQRKKAKVFSLGDFGEGYRGYCFIYKDMRVAVVPQAELTGNDFGQVAALAAVRTTEIYENSANDYPDGFGVAA